MKNGLLFVVTHKVPRQRADLEDEEGVYSEEHLNKTLQMNSYLDKCMRRYK